jgi:glycosyltransferase involved in cell wall biosynthesis
MALSDIPHSEDGASPRGFAARFNAFSDRVLRALRYRRVLITRKYLPLRHAVHRKLGFAGKPQGVNLAAYIRAEMGLGEAARGTAAALEAAGIPFNVINFQDGNPSRHNDTTWAHKEAPNRAPSDTTLLCINFDNVLNARFRLPRAAFNNRYVIGSWFWELADFPDEWLFSFSVVNEVWVASRFMQDAFSVKATVPVVRIPPVVQLMEAGSHSREYFNLPQRRFLFLTMADARSSLERKNPLGAVRAFKEAFGDDESVGLILKINNPDYVQPEMEALKEELRGCENIFLLDQVMTRPEVNSLLALADCFVSLHRAEGFGLPPAEAMSLGKPAILTNWSGNVDYMTANNCIAIDYQLVPIERDHGYYRVGQCWADPDVEQAAHWMKRVARDPDLAARIGSHAQETIRREYSPEVVGRQIARRLEYIRRSRW